MSAPVQTENRAAEFVRRRLTRGVPYGLGFTLALAFVVAAVLAFAGVASAVDVGAGIARLDVTAHQALFDAFGASRALGLAVTWFGNSLTVTTGVVLVSLALVAARRYGLAFRVVFASGLGGLVVTGLKQLFSRDRPLDGVIEAAGYSFPSGHAFASTVFYGMVVYLVFRLTDRLWARGLAVVLGLLVIVAVGLSRVYLNVHFLTDVVGGWLSGAAWLTASLLIVDAAERHVRGRGRSVGGAVPPDDAALQPRR